MKPAITKMVAQDLALGKNGSYGPDGNVLQDSLWDQLTFAATTARATTTFFSVPQGTTKGLTETNLTDPSKLPNGQTFLTKVCCVNLIANVQGADTDANTIMAAYYNIMENSIFEIKIAGREFEMRKPGKEFLPAVAVSGLSSAVNPAAPQAYFLANGKIKLNATPIPFGQLVTFQFLQRTASIIAGVTTIVNTASDVLATQEAQLHTRFEGILTRAI